MSRGALARRRRLAAALRLIASAAWLALVLLVFRVPLGRAVYPMTRAAGLGGLLHPAASGFLLRVTSVPPGGRLRVDGVDRGTVPLLANVACQEGQVVRLRVVKEGFAPWERQVRCREGKTLIVRARLGGSSPP